MFSCRAVAAFASDTRDCVRRIEVAARGGCRAVATEAASDFFRRHNSTGSPVERTRLHLALVRGEVKSVQITKVAEPKLAKPALSF